MAGQQRTRKRPYLQTLGVHPLGEFELEGGTREVFELSRKRFERVEEALGSGEGVGCGSLARYGKLINRNVRDACKPGVNRSRALR